jgi:hypothetical protein
VPRSGISLNELLDPGRPTYQRDRDLGRNTFYKIKRHVHAFCRKGLLCLCPDLVRSNGVKKLTSCLGQAVGKEVIRPGAENLCHLSLDLARLDQQLEIIRVLVGSIFWEVG